MLNKHKQPEAVALPGKEVAGLDRIPGLLEEVRRVSQSLVDGGENYLTRISDPVKREEELGVEYGDAVRALRAVRYLPVFRTYIPHDVDAQVRPEAIREHPGTFSELLSPQELSQTIINERLRDFRDNGGEPVVVERLYAVMQKMATLAELDPVFEDLSSLARKAMEATRTYMSTKMGYVIAPSTRSTCVEYREAEMRRCGTGINIQETLSPLITNSAGAIRFPAVIRCSEQPAKNAFRPPPR